MSDDHFNKAIDAIIDGTRKSRVEVPVEKKLDYIADAVGSLAIAVGHFAQAAGLMETAALCTNACISAVKAQCGHEVGEQTRRAIIEKLSGLKYEDINALRSVGMSTEAVFEALEKKEPTDGN